MKRIYLMIFSIVFLCFNLWASPHYKKHTVIKGETLFSISHQYGIKVTDLVKVNPDLKAKKELKIGLQLNIPATTRVTAEAAKTIRKDTLVRKAKLAEVPSTPETPYRDEDNQAKVAMDTKGALSTTNNDNTVIISKNGTANNNALSQPLVEKSDVPVVVAPKVETAATPFSIRTNSANPADYAALFSQYTARNYGVKRDRGAANYLADNSSGNPYLALYSGAETGSVIKVTNMMNNKSVFVKVVGKVPQADASKEVILKLSHKVAEDLGAIDEKFLVEVAGVPAN